MKLVDTNIFLRYITRDDPLKAQDTKGLFDRVIQGYEEVLTTDVIVHEVCYVLAASTFYNLSHQDVRDRLYPLLQLPALKMPNKELCLAALDVFAQSEKVDFADALSVAYI